MVISNYSKQWQSKKQTKKIFHAYNSASCYKYVREIAVAFYPLKLISCTAQLRGNYQF